MTRYSVAVFLLLALSLTQCARAQPSPSFEGGPDASWNSRRIVMLRGFGDYYAEAPDGAAKLVKPDGLGVNIVAVVQRVEGDRIWIEANGNGDAPVG